VQYDPNYMRKMKAQQVSPRKGKRKMATPSTFSGDETLVYGTGEGQQDEHYVEIQGLVPEADCTKVGGDIPNDRVSFRKFFAEMKHKGMPYKLEDGYCAYHYSGYVAPQGDEDSLRTFLRAVKADTDQERFKLVFVPAR